MDELDRRLLVELQDEPRKSNASLAKILGISERSVSKKIEHLLSSGEIIFSALPDMETFGYFTSAYIAIKTNHQSDATKIARQLCECPQLRLVSICAGFADIFVGGNFESNKGLALFITDYLAKIEGISRIDTMVELQTLKKKLFGRLENDKKSTLMSSPKPNVSIDKIDYNLVLELQKDSRAPLKKLANELNLSAPTIKRRIRKLVASGALELTAIPKAAAIGFPIDGIIGVEAELPDLVRIAMSIGQYTTQVGMVGIYSGPIPLFVYLSAPDSESLTQFASKTLTGIEGVRRIDFLIILENLKRMPPRIHPIKTE
jgi:DNA-binding Lrp family transcriptional regulator